LRRVEGAAIRHPERGGCAEACPAPWRIRIIRADLQVEKEHRTPNTLFLTGADGANECLGEIHRMND
jgi:hypothetical protein